MLKQKKIMSMVVSLVLLLCSFTFPVQAVDVDAYLLNAGFPQVLIDEMSEQQKNFYIRKIRRQKHCFL